MKRLKNIEGHVKGIEQMVENDSYCIDVIRQIHAVQAALEKAEQIIEKDKLIHLSKKDAQFFFDVLDNPPEPNAKLINAVKNYRAHIK